jgi:hypothetical protein
MLILKTQQTLVKWPRVGISARNKCLYDPPRKHRGLTLKEKA